MHLYQLGQYFHKRYGKLIGNGYQQDKVYVLSTDHDRAIMSAQANLAGMFEPNETEIWHQQILWQPIPVRKAQIKKAIARLYSFIQKKHHY